MFQQWRITFLFIKWEIKNEIFSFLTVKCKDMKKRAYSAFVFGRVGSVP